jgi:hypothetical protein
MRFLVTGGRDFANFHAMAHALQQMPSDATLVHGAAKGADALAAEYWSKIHERPTEAHPADWATHGKGAGPIRNQKMLDTGVDLVLAFPGGSGTADMVRRARAAGVKVIIVGPKS